MAPRFCRLHRCFPFARRPLLCLLEPFSLFFIHCLHEASPLLSSSPPRQASLGAIVAAGDLCGKWDNTLSGGVFFKQCYGSKGFEDEDVAMQARCVSVALSLVTASIQVCGSHPSAVCCTSQGFRSSKNSQCRWTHIQGVCTLNFPLCDPSIAGFRTAALGGSGGLQPKSGSVMELFNCAILLFGFLYTLFKMIDYLQCTV